VNNYYDHGFDTRYSQYGSRNDNLQATNTAANAIFRELFNVNITNNTPSLITSTADSCKIKQGLVFNHYTIDEKCPEGAGHNPPCTSWLQSYIDFIDDVTNSDNPSYISILWTGNILYGDDKLPYNRSFAWYRNGITIQEIIVSETYYTEILPTLIHELAHQFGAPDHYHEINPETNKCKNEEFCSDCCTTEKNDRHIVL
jgi:hypothetical protein